MNQNPLILQEEILQKIHYIRGQKVMLDQDLALLYQVETKNLKRQVRRNIERFPEDFMFVLNKEEYQHLRSQIGTSSIHGGTRYLPMAFTEQGVAMLSSVLGSPIAVRVNIQIIRTFVKMREVLLSDKELVRKIDELEKRMDHNDSNINEIFNYLKQLVQQKQEPRKKIGFKQP